MKYVDHTLLTQTATWEEIRQILDDAIKIWNSLRMYSGFLCKAGCRICRGKASHLHSDRFFQTATAPQPLRYLRQRDAVANGASEIDMVINIGKLKDKKYEEIEEEIRQIHQACGGRILKVIIETCLLTEDEKIKMCEIVTKAGAEYIKTSTGFSTGGATFADVELMRKHVGKEVKVKAAGGISSFDDAEEFIRLGAERLGTSRLVKIMKNSPDAGNGY